MLNKLKLYLYGSIGTIITVLLGYVYYLTGRNSVLKSKVAILESDKNLVKVEGDYDKQKKVAEDAEGEYIRLRDEYIRHGSDGSTDE